MMAKQAFNLGDQLAEVLGKVSESDTAPEQIVYVDITLIDEDKNNFYSMDGIDELAASIELIGLQQPVRLRENPDMPGRYLLVSGHRRRRAFWSLYEENPEKWRRIAAIIEKPAASPELQELRLILANSDTRRMSSADLAKQVERVQMLLYKLKEEGVIQFSGRMRDAVAEACKVSSTRLAQLKVIQEKLIDVYRLLWDAGKLNETCAYTIAKEPADVQRRVYEEYGAGETVQNWPQWQIANAIETVRNPTAKKKPEENGFDPEEYARQLDKEREMLRCAIREAWLEWFCGTISRGRLPDTRNDAIDRLKKCYRNAGSWGADLWSYDGRPNGLEIRTPDRKEKFLAHYTDIFDQLALLAIDELFSRFEKDRKEKRESALAAAPADEPNWRRGMPPREGRYLCLVNMNTGKLHEQKCDYKEGKWIAFGMDLSDMSYEVKAWYPLPEETAFLPVVIFDEEEDDEE